MELRSYLATLKRYRVFLIVTIALSVLISFLGSYFFDSYTASSTVQLIPDQSESASITKQLTAAQQDVTIAGPDPRQVLLNNAVELLKSRPVAEQIVNEIQLDDRAQSQSIVARAKRALGKAKRVTWDILKYASYKTKPKHERNIDFTQAALSGTPITNSFALTISATTNDPKLSRDIADAAVKVLQARLSDQSKESAKAGVSDAAAALYEAARGLREARANVSTALAAGAAHQPPGLAPTDAVAVQGIDSQISANEAQLATLTDQLASLSSASPLFGQLQADKLSLERQNASLQAQRQSLTTDTGITEALTNATIAGDNYLTLASELERAQSQALRSPEPLRVLSMSVPPLYPTGIARLYWVLGGLLLSAMIAVALVFTLDYYDTSLRSAQDAELLLGTPLLASVSIRELQPRWPDKGAEHGDE